MRNNFFIGINIFGILATITLAVLDIINSMQKFNNGLLSKEKLISNLIINSLIYIVVIIVLVLLIVVRKNRK